MSQDVPTSLSRLSFLTVFLFFVSFRNDSFFAWTMIFFLFFFAEGSVFVPPLSPHATQSPAFFLSFSLSRSALSPLQCIFLHFCPRFSMFPFFHLFHSIKMSDLSKALLEYTWKPSGCMMQVFLQAAVLQTDFNVMYCEDIEKCNVCESHLLMMLAGRIVKHAWLIFSHTFNQCVSLWGSYTKAFCVLPVTPSFAGHLT